MSHYYLNPALYAITYADYTADVPALVAAVQAGGGPALEVCCGDGRVLVPLLEAGVDADGLDLEPGMIAAVRAKLAAKGLKAATYEADMRDFTLPRRYRRILIAFNSFLHNLTQEDQLHTLRCCREHLDEDGALLVAAFHPTAEKLLELAGEGKWTKDAPIEGTSDRLRVFDRTEDDALEQIRRLSRRIERVNAAGEVIESHDVTFDIRYVYKPEMELLLRVAGFKRWDVAPHVENYREGGGIAATRPVRAGDHLLWTAWKI